MTLNVLYSILSLGKLTPQVLITLSFSFILTGNQLIHVIVLVKLLIKKAFKQRPSVKWVRELFISAAIIILLFQNTGLFLREILT